MPHKSPHLIHPQHRPDIDGLRAVSIISVIVFHAFPELMKGGFIGVDIFFVISGFLISTIIFSSLERDRFSIVGFYIRRIRRIFPALILVMVATLVIGWFVLSSGEYKQLGKHIAGGAGFVSNFILHAESGYFDNAAETKPLLHLWSLAIEEQFYLFWPLLLAFVWKRHWNFLGITAAIAIVSFAANIYLINTSPESAFYLSISRFWELMIGGVLAYTALHHPQLYSHHKNGQSMLGFTLLAAALILVNKERSFPGWWALLPTLGALLIISAGPSAWLNKKLLANKLMVWIGLISYPLYLWHWVLLSYLRIEESYPSKEMRLGILIISILFAWITYKLIETPIRIGKNAKAKAVALLVSIIVLFCVGYFIFNQNGLEKWKVDAVGESNLNYLNYFENSIPEQNYFIKTGLDEKFRFDCDFFDIDKYRAGQSTVVPKLRINESCFLRDRSYQKAVLIWGDSHAQQLYFGIKNNLPADWQTLIVASTGVRPDLHAEHSSNSNWIIQSNWFALKTISDAKPDVVIVAQEGGHSTENMNAIIAKLREMGVKKIIFTGPTPHWKPDLPKLIARKMWNNTPKRTYIGINKNLMGADRQLQSRFVHQDNALYVSLIDFFCNTDGCLTYIGDDKKTGVTTWDYGHLTPIASDLLAKDLLVDIITGSKQ